MVRRALAHAIVIVVAALVVATPAASQPAAQIRDAVTRGVAAITAAQKVWANSKQVCASCHHQFQPAHAFKAAREHGIPVDESIARADAAAAFSYADLDRAIQYTHVIEPAVDDAQRMVAADAAGVKPNLATSVYVKLLLSRQNADGTWDSYHQRPPSSYSRITFAALGLRAVGLFHHPSHQIAHVVDVHAIAKLALEPIAVEERHEQLEVLFLAVVRRRGHQKEMTRDTGEELTQLVPLCVLHLTAEKRRIHENRVDDQRPGLVVFPDFEAYLVAADEIRRLDHLFAIVDHLIDVRFLLHQGPGIGTQHQIPCRIFGKAMHSGITDADFSGIGTGLDHEIVFEKPSLAVVLDVDTRVDFRISNFSVGTNVGPVRGSIALQIIYCARQGV